MFTGALIAFVLVALIVICAPKAAASAPMPGIIAGAYRNTGTGGSPTWVEMTSVIGATGFTEEWDFGDASKRSTRAKLYDKTQVELGGSLKVLADPAAADYVALYTASQSGSASIDLMVINGKVTIEGAIGVRAAYKVKRTEGQDAGNILYDDFECKPYMGGASPVTPSTVIMGSASAASFTTL
jgi:hypothetical protein